MIQQLTFFDLNNFYNTVPIKDNVELEKVERKATACRDAVLKLFTDNPDKDYTPYEVWKKTGKRWTKNSIQARITTLTEKDKLLVITGNKRKGEFEIKTNTWKAK